ncbi:hypothetical protein LV779_08490 [Streptomyces thinghirensis]|nr:hypothetical protein [Streptomyces thinghirensis]
MLFGDVTYGDAARIFLEKVKGRDQGAVFRHTRSLEAGVNRITQGPDGEILRGRAGRRGQLGPGGQAVPRSAEAHPERRPRRSTSRYMRAERGGLSWSTPSRCPRRRRTSSPRATGSSSGATCRHRRTARPQGRRGDPR